jgi:hypothetical protein
MADPTRPPNSEDITGAGRDRGSASGMPRWVKLLGVIAAVVVALAITLMLSGGHGPGRHMHGGLVSPATVAQHEQPL